ncbi:hypothetical protein FJU31_04205 [Stenotrophomonas cyclobalanopsidis]|uniref:DUF4760 domain-containing protein n=1 Tax=Stenotrophomonas cyclobalanopsidis TaxID=2771362 RepID=A0ABQ6T4G8_9GAMM|nr:hypothetical protein [Stenotrophomonas cyclobalanopsidis]KAA9003513.1 hypothetical protein FJU31_04205 [Stenotrophomonas cyclobalanopsidis]
MANFTRATRGISEMSFSDGISECWWLSETCVINWDAWASIGTVAGVVTALSVPAVKRFFASRRVSAIFAAAHVTQLETAQAAIKNFKSVYSFAAPSGEAIDKRLALKNDAGLVEAAEALIENLAPVRALEVDLSKYPDVGTLLAADVSRSLYFVSYISKLAGLLQFDRSRVEDEVWIKFCVAFDRNLSNGLAVLDHATEGCSAAIGHMSILKRFR